MPRFSVDFIGQCSLEVEAKDENEAREKAEALADTAKNEREMQVQLWENLQVESVSRV